MRRHDQRGEGGFVIVEKGNNGGEGPPEVQNLAVVLSVSQSDRPENLRSTVMEGKV